MVFKPLSGSFQLRTLHCRATLICASFGRLIIYYHFPFSIFFYLQVRSEDYFPFLLQHPEPDERVPLYEDLQGFWDMIKIQVDNVDDHFAEIHHMSQNGWKEIPKLAVRVCMNLFYHKSMF